MLKKLILSIMIFSVIGVVFPSASADVFIHKPTPQFSIQHPNGWTVQEFPEYRLVSIDADATGRNGVSIMLVCSNLYGEDCGTPQADYQEIEFLKQDSIYSCDSVNYQEHYMICYNQQIAEEYFHIINGFRAFSILVEETWHQDGKDPYYPDSGGAHKMLALNTYVLVGNDIWFIGIYDNFDNFSMEQSEKILSTFKINNIYDQDDLFSQSSWLDNLIKAIMSLFNWGNDSSSSTNTVIEQPSEAEYQPEQNYDYDNPIIMELDTCDYWEC